MKTFLKCQPHHDRMRVIYFDSVVNKLLHVDQPFSNKFTVAIPANVTSTTNYIAKLTGLDSSSIVTIGKYETPPPVIGVVGNNRVFYEVTYKGRYPVKYKSVITPGEIYNAQLHPTTKFMLENDICIGTDLNKKKQLNTDELNKWIDRWQIMFIRKSTAGIHILQVDELLTVQTATELHNQVRSSKCMMVVHTDTDSRLSYSYKPEDFNPISIDLKQLLLSWHGDSLIKKPVIDRVLYNNIFHPSENVKKSTNILYNNEVKDNFALLKECRTILKKDLMAIVLVLNTTQCGQLEDMNRPNNLYLAQRMISGACHKMGVLIEKPSNPEDEIKEKGIGAHVKRASKGVYGKVYDLDMRAMYPSAIMDMEYDSNDVYIRVLREGYIRPLYNLRMNLLGQIDNCTDLSRKSVLDTHQNICKLLMNKMTGLLNCNNRFIKSDPKIYNAMTAFGRETMKQAIKYVSDNGYKVIFADTDGLMVRAVRKNTGKKRKKIDHETRLIEIAGEFNGIINRDSTKYSQLVFKGSWDKVFIYGDKSYDAVKNGLFTCKGAFDYASTDIEKFIYKTILAYIVFEDDTLAPFTEADWQKDIRLIIRKAKGKDVTKRIESILLEIMDYLNDYVFLDVAPWATVMKLRPDPTMKWNYELIPVVLLSLSTDNKNHDYLLLDNSNFQQAVLRNRLGSGIGAYEICKQTRSNMLTKKTSKWITALEQ